MLQVSSMFCFIFLSLVSSLFQFSHAGPTEILKNGHLAYYGADFYSSKPLTRNDLYLIVAGRHIHFNGGYDQITEQTNCGSDCYEQTKNEQFANKNESISEFSKIFFFRFIIA